MNSMYIWTGTEVIELIPKGLRVIKQEIPTNCYGKPAVDTAFDAPTERYGTYQDVRTAWMHIPLAMFPSEFRAHLLIMGVQ